MTREMDFRSLELRQVASYAAGSVVGISVAVAGFGAWAIIAQQLGVAAMSSLLLFVFSPWRPGLRFSRSAVRRLGGFGANVFGARFLFYLNRNVDNILIGRFIGPSALGRVCRLVQRDADAVQPDRRHPCQEVMLPALARSQAEPARLASMWLRANRDRCFGDGSRDVRPDGRRAGVRAGRPRRQLGSRNPDRARARLGGLAAVVAANERKCAAGARPRSVIARLRRGGRRRQRDCIRRRLAVRHSGRRNRLCDLEYLRGAVLHVGHCPLGGDRPPRRLAQPRGRGRGSCPDDCRRCRPQAVPARSGSRDCYATRSFSWPRESRCTSPSASGDHHRSPRN